MILSTSILIVMQIKVSHDKDTFEFYTEGNVILDDTESVHKELLIISSFTLQNVLVRKDLNQPCVVELSRNSTT